MNSISTQFMAFLAFENNFIYIFYYKNIWEMDPLFWTENEPLEQLLNRSQPATVMSGAYESDFVRNGEQHYAFEKTMIKLNIYPSLPVKSVPVSQQRLYSREAHRLSLLKVSTSTTSSSSVTDSILAPRNNPIWPPSVAGYRETNETVTSMRYVANAKIARQFLFYIFYFSLFAYLHLEHIQINSRSYV